MEEIIHKENDWDHVTEASMIEGNNKKVNRKEMAIAIKVMKPGKAAGPSEVCAGMISASGKVEVNMMRNFANAYWMKKKCWMNGKQVCWYQLLMERKTLEIAMHTEERSC